jgi:hypothetical protein
LSSEEERREKEAQVNSIFKTTEGDSIATELQNTIGKKRKAFNSCWTWG